MKCVVKKFLTAFLEGFLAFLHLSEFYALNKISQSSSVKGNYVTEVWIVKQYFILFKN